MQAMNNPGYLLLHLAFTMARQNDQLLQERLGIGFSQFKILMVLENTPHVQQRQIADSLGQTEASISRQIKLMTEAGLLRSTISPANRRERITTLTNKGVRLVEEAMVALNSYHAPMFGSISDNNRQQLVESLALMHESVCRNGKPGACHHPFDTSA